MSERLETKFEIKSWDEKPYRELPDGRKFAEARVALAAAEAGIEGEATFDALLYYHADGTSSYVTLMQFTGRLGEREGSFVLSGSGTYDGTHARGESTVVPGSGTGDLAGLRGTAVSVSTHADYPYMPLTLEYDLG
ncbi:MAG: DUF3224 domain-containing protein [Micromonosporaceae bacterium]|nr:DUF3224 domain-containing protein [Micromonosporaceae bacterium]